MSMYNNDPNTGYISFYCYVAHENGGCAKQILRYPKIGPSSNQIGEFDSSNSSYEPLSADRCYNLRLFK